VKQYDRIFLVMVVFLRFEENILSLTMQSVYKSFTYTHLHTSDY